MDPALTPERLVADTLYQRAVLSVYGPWLTSRAVSLAERRRAVTRVHHARLALAAREPNTPSRTGGLCPGKDTPP